MSHLIPIFDIQSGVFSSVQHFPVQLNALVSKPKLNDICVLKIPKPHKSIFFENKKFNFFLLNRVAWVSYVTSVGMQMLCVFVGCLLYAKYSQCDPLRANIISRPDQVKNEFRN